MPARVPVDNRHGKTIRISRARWTLRVCRLIANRRRGRRLRIRTNEKWSERVQKLLGSQTVLAHAAVPTHVTSELTKSGAAARAAARKAAREANASNLTGNDIAANATVNLSPSAGTPTESVCPERSVSSASAETGVAAGAVRSSAVSKHYDAATTKHYRESDSFWSTMGSSGGSVRSGSDVAQQLAGIRLGSPDNKGKGRGKGAPNGGNKPVPIQKLRPLGNAGWQEITLDENDKTWGFKLKHSAANSCPTVSFLDSGAKVGNVSHVGSRLLRVDGLDTSMLTEGQLQEMLGNTRPLRLRFGQ